MILGTYKLCPAHLL